MVLTGRRCLELQQLDGDGVGPPRGPPRRLPHLLPVLIHPEVAPQPPPPHFFLINLYLIKIN